MVACARALAPTARFGVQNKHKTGGPNSDLIPYSIRNFQSIFFRKQIEVRMRVRPCLLKRFCNETY